MHYKRSKKNIASKLCSSLLNCKHSQFQRNDSYLILGSSRSRMQQTESQNTSCNNAFALMLYIIICNKCLPLIHLWQLSQLMPLILIVNSVVQHHTTILRMHTCKNFTGRKFCELREWLQVCENKNIKYLEIVHGKWSTGDCHCVSVIPICTAERLLPKLTILVSW